MGRGACWDEPLRRLHAHGASRVYVEADNYRNAALVLYEACGFGVARHVLVFRRDCRAGSADWL